MTIFILRICVLPYVQIFRNFLLFYICILSNVLKTHNSLQ